MFLLIVVTFSATALMVGCSENKGDQNPVFEIKEVEKLPFVEPYKNFDILTSFEREDGVTYDYSVKYVDDMGDESDLELSDSFIYVEKDKGYVVVSVSAVKGEEKAEKDITLTIQGTPDAVDNGFSILWGEEGIIKKNLNYNPEYIKDGNSSLKVSFGGYYYEYGTQIANFLGRLCTVESGTYDENYFSIYKDHKDDQEEAWKDAVISFWVYYANTPKNHPDAKLDIGYRFRHNDGEEVSAPYARDYEFGDSPIVSCEPGQWTQVAIRLKDLGKVTALHFNYEKYVRMVFNIDTDCDFLSFKCRVSDEDYNSGEVKYTYSFYMDGVNISTYADFVRDNPSFDFGADHGATVSGQYLIENWLEGDKGISFEYSLDDPDTAGVNSFALFASDASGWYRLTEWINIDFINNVAYVGEDTESGRCGKIVDLGNGKFRYELMFEDATLNLASGEEPDGTETLNLLYYRDYNTKIKSSEYKVIGAYSE